MKHLLFALTFLPLASTLAGHNALLPRPQQVQYGNGSLTLSHLTIRFAAAPSAEDQFAAQQLAARLSAITGGKIEIAKGRGYGKTIVLKREENGGALPADRESVGPDSRESYTLVVTPKGAEIRGRTSAGVFYGVQTLLQMI